ncbi:porin family protein [Halomonas sp. M20]|uniref:porin family protein n=1 Tax=Halomonas sp. M20 TaxID=2763264 RepID=UPI001D09A966|nr:porin family protein [Halomonas sp. M20]
MKFKTLVAASCASTLMIAFAPSILAAPNADGLYLGIGTGFSSLKNNRGEVSDFISDGVEDFDPDDDDDNVFKGFVGYEFNPYFATELFYADLGRTRWQGGENVNTDLESRAYGVSAIGQLPIASWLTLFAKAGIAKWNTDVKSNLSGSDMDDQDGTDPVYGVGAQFNFEPFMVRTEYERYDFDNNYKIDTFTASAGFKF